MDSLPVTTQSNLKNRKLVIMVVSILVLFLIIGGIIGYFRAQKLIKNEQNVNDATENVVEYLDGKVTYIGDTGNGISYSLSDAGGKDIALLKSVDSKLKIVEGLNVRVYGTLVKGTSGEKDILIVKEVVIQNGSN